ncbi:MAG: hypothetical protein WAM28_08620 [Chlamydiales bacterium]
MNPYFEVVNHPERFFSFEDETTFKPLGLSECNCISFSRLKNNRRACFESAIVNHLDTACSREIPLKLLILGAGKLLDTWVLMGKLMQKAFALFELYLVDPKINMNSFRSFQSFYDQFPEIKLISYPLRSIHQLPRSKRFHAICAIDFDEIHYVETMRDFNASACYLAENGRLFFDYANTDFVCSKQGLEQILHTDNFPIMEDLTKIIPFNTKKLSIFAHRQTLDALICMMKTLREKQIYKPDIYYDPQIYDLELHSDFFKICHPQFSPPKSMEERSDDLIPDLVTSCYENCLYGEIWSKKGKKDLPSPCKKLGGTKRATHTMHQTVTNYLISKEKIHILRL